jgi:hypothetical protein
MADVDQSHRTHAAKRRSQDESEPECRTEHSECTGALLRHAYPDQSFAAFVAKIYPEADRQKGTVKVEVKLRDPDLRIIKPEMSAKVTFMANEGHASAARLVIVPISSRRGSNKNRRRTMVAASLRFEVFSGEVRKLRACSGDARSHRHRRTLKW